VVPWSLLALAKSLSSELALAKTPNLHPHPIPINQWWLKAVSSKLTMFSIAKKAIS
jgi:hypothetical protein